MVFPAMAAPLASSSIGNRNGRNPVTEDFVGLFHQEGLDHLTQKIMLMLISPENDKCSLTEAKLVSNMWKEAVDNLVLETTKGKDMCLHRIKEVMRRTVSKFADWAQKRRNSCGCLAHAARTLQSLENLQVSEKVRLVTELYRQVHELDLLLYPGNKMDHPDYMAELECLVTVFRGSGEGLENALAWKERMMMTPVDEPMDDWKRALRSVLVYRLYCLKRADDNT